MYQDNEIETFLQVVGDLFSMYLYRNILSSSNEPEDLKPKNTLFGKEVAEPRLELIDRQLAILRLISEDRTNQSISQFLGYSESTIRQEL